jgi:hypothetical protein
MAAFSKLLTKLRPLKYVSNPFQGFNQDRSRAGEIDSLKTFTLNAEDVAFIKVDPGFF